jgi:hypothetical protein
LSKPVPASARCSQRADSAPGATSRNAPDNTGSEFARIRLKMQKMPLFLAQGTELFAEVRDYLPADNQVFSAFRGT